jgi:hypothetical protein
VLSPKDLGKLTVVVRTGSAMVTKDLMSVR